MNKLAKLLPLVISLAGSHSYGAEYSKYISPQPLWNAGPWFSSQGVPAQCTGTPDPASLIGNNPVTLLSGLANFINTTCQDVTCQKMTTTLTGTCSDTSLYWNGSFNCGIEKTITYIPGPSCTQDPAAFSWTIKGELLSAQKNCNIQNSTWRYDNTSKNCVCANENEAWVPDANVCAPIRDRVRTTTGTCGSGTPGNPSGIGNPIDPLTGAKSQTITLISDSNSPQIAIEYNSNPKLAPIGERGFAPPPSPGFGELWSSNVHLRLFAQGTTIQAHRGLGKWESLSKYTGTSAYPEYPGATNHAELYSDGAFYTDPSGELVEFYNASRQIAYKHKNSGELYYYFYSTAASASAPAAGLLTEIQDRRGRSTRINYDLTLPANSTRVIEIITSSGGNILFSYDLTGNLEYITWQDGTKIRFLYELTNLKWALTGVVDESGDRLSTYTYDSSGRATGTERAGGTLKYTANWSTPPIWQITDTYDAVANVIWRDHWWTAAGGMTLQSPNGQLSSVGTSSIIGIPKYTTRTQPAGSGCAASTSSMSYDNNGNTASSDDFNGNRTCYTSDLARNLEITRIEGLPKTSSCAPLTDTGAVLPTGARKTSTAWHPKWNKITQQSTPRLLTYYVYNGQPDPFANNAIASCTQGGTLVDGSPIVVLCKQVEQPTTDTNGSLGFLASPTGIARSRSYTYNGAGQILTETDPRNKVTTYTYYADATIDHAVGDLERITNAAGHTTIFKQYDKAGRLLQSIDPNGITSDITYKPRGWVETVKVTPPVGGGSSQVTTYTYDAVGQLKEVLLPDATKITYTYDPAHRLTGIKDGAGNTVSYTLDNFGNRTSEDFKDPAGALARSITRGYDALNRVQSVTGAQ